VSAATVPLEQEDRPALPQEAQAFDAAVKRAAGFVGFVSAAEWPKPEKLPAENPPVEAFSTELLPDALRPWIEDISDRVQCPPDFPAVAAVVALGSVLGRKVAIFPKRHDDWHEYANIWGAIVGSPGVLKSPALFEALRPLRSLERAANARHVDALKEWSVQRAARQIRLAADRANAIRAAKKAQTFDVGGLGDLEDEDEPPLRRYVVNDASVEALGEILRGNPDGTLAYRDELVGLLKQLDREGNEGARSFYLTAWGAKEGHTFDRIGRGLNRRVEGVCLSVLGSIQPCVIGEYLREAAATGGGDGLMSRFSLLTWPDVSGQWRNVDRFPDSRARDTASATFRAFDEIPSVAYYPGEPAGVVRALRFDDEAQEWFDEWRERYEERQRSGEDHPALVAHRNKYRKLVPAIALICHLADEPNAPAVGLRSLLRAEAWLDYLDTHARRAYASVMRADADSARELLRRIRRHDVPDSFRLRDVYRNQWSLLSTPDQARRAAQMLVDFDYVREIPVDTGGRRTSVFRINPRSYS
jgi:hypothetical protein